SGPPSRAGLKACTTFDVMTMRPIMLQRLHRTPIALASAAFVLLVSAATSVAEPIRLARHPDYHAGRIAFSYLGDIWTANGDGSAPQRLTDNRGHEVYPRFSPDGKWIAFSSNRFGNNDVFVVAANGGTPRRLTFH